MIRLPRSPSLFWTFAGSFLLVLVVATLLQGLAVVTVVNSLTARWTKERADTLLQDISRRVESLGKGAGDFEVARLLREGNPNPGPLVLAFQRPDGRTILPYRFPPPVHRRIHRLMLGQPDSLGPGPPGGGPPPEMPGREIPFEPPPPRPGPQGPPIEWRGGPGDPAGQQFRVVARRPLQGTGPAGELAALTPRGRFAFWPEGAMQRLLLFLPIAVLLAGAAGTILFRILIRRLRAMEHLAARIAEGNLDARVPEGTDEIGRLGARLNRMTEALDSARKKIEDNDRQRRRLQADITHELATPLTSIRGYAETLLDPNVPVSAEERALYLRNVLEESERMDRLIADLLELSRLEAGAAPLSPVRLDWAALCRNTVDRFRPLFREAGLTLEWTAGEHAEEAWVQADGRLLEQVMENLLTNALRYVPAGGTVEVSMVATGANAERFRLGVADDGPGISEAEIPHIFDRFYRAASARSRPGSGLGLAIVREIVSRHGGDIRAERRDPSGIVISIDLQAAP